ncbi:hypothetical protein HDU67_001324, partial [Dinochytrium kinnereticum]
MSRCLSFGLHGAKGTGVDLEQEKSERNQKKTGSKIMSVRKERTHGAKTKIILTRDMAFANFEEWKVDLKTDLDREPVPKEYLKILYKLSLYQSPPIRIARAYPLRKFPDHFVFVRICWEDVGERLGPRCRSRLLETRSYFDFVPHLVAGVYPFSMVLIDDLLAGVVVPQPAGAGLDAAAANPNEALASASSADDSDASSWHLAAPSSSSLSGGVAERARLAAEMAEIRRENDHLRLPLRGSSRGSVAGAASRPVRVVAPESFVVILVLS